MNLQSLASANFKKLCENPYPGRGIVQGRDRSGEFLVQVYWIMGRSENSRNRVFSMDEEGCVFTEAADPAQVKDPRLIIYNAMRSGRGAFVVSNGSQTDTVMNNVSLMADYRLHNALLSEEYEPDAPNWTPRIAGMCVVKGSYCVTSQLSIVRKSLFGGGCDRLDYYHEDMAPGLGYGITTYRGDGDPLPSWEGDPILLPLNGSIDNIADGYFANLNQENMVSLAVKFIPLSGEASMVSIRNKYQKV